MGGAGSVKCHIYQDGDLYSEKQGPRALHSNSRQNNLESEKGSKNFLQIMDTETFFCKGAKQEKSRS